MGALALLLLLIPHEGHTASDWSASWAARRRGRKGAVRYALELGGRLSFHYNRAQMITTPPESRLAEAMLHFWFGRGMALYLSYARPVSAGDSTSMFAFGMKLPILDLATGGNSTLSGVTMMVVVDGLRFSYPPPELPMIYPESGFALRYGGAIHWMIGKGGLYIDSTMLGTYLNENFFIAPMLGVGYHF
ncbi:MAG: hypothetical protein NDJ89_18790 [Oligoflexia bacterium]|nr:hypothetical protein [Oligoflexia bacterium]